MVQAFERMLKTAANKAAGKKEPQTYPLGYVEDFLQAENEVGGRFQHPLLGDGNELPYPRPETSRISTLNVDESWPPEPTDKPFA